MGSPPHTWRIHFKLTSGDITVRITSTYVENTLNNSCHVRQNGDHLHIRGEYGGRCRLRSLQLGSPPHTWRIHYKPLERFSDLRITSTYVENTVGFISRIQAIKDHLHIRGEYLRYFEFKLAELGSPPHTWRIHVLN